MIHYRRLFPSLAFTCIIITPLVLASIGDRSPAYQRCVSSCVSECPPAQPWKIELWPCKATCQYSCMTTLTDLALFHYAFVPNYDTVLISEGSDLEGLYIGQQVQFHGKWPFRRYLGMQEIVSVLFSIANLWAHQRGFSKLGVMSLNRPGARNLAWCYRLYAISGMNTWIWSSVFHTRDLNWTEKADYFSAAGGMLCGLWVVGMRLAGFYGQHSKSRWKKIWSCTCLFIWCAHCTYLGSGRFDYTYNMRFNIAVALLQILMWSYWSLTHLWRPTIRERSDAYRKISAKETMRAPHYLKPIPPLLLLPSLTALELLDFAPVPQTLRLLDAHALWHASTVGVVILWYSFLLEDVRWMEVCADEPALRAEETNYREQ